MSEIRTRRPRVTRQRAAQVALEIIDADGLEALTLGRVAEAMHVRSPSLYHHFQDKDDLLREVARSIILSAPWPPDPAGGAWQDWLVEIAIQYRRTLLRHPNAAPLLLRFFPRRILASQYERSSQLLLRYDVPVHLHLLLFEGLDKLTVGSALYAAQFAQQDAREGFLSIDPERDVALVAVLEESPWVGEELFAESLRSFIRGALAAARPRGRRARRSRLDARPTVSLIDNEIDVRSSADEVSPRR